MSSNSRFAVSVHLLAALGWMGEQCTSAKLATSVNTNPVVVRRLLGRLVEAGLVEAHPGRRGGFELARAPESIDLAEVYRAVEESGLFALHANPEAEHCPVSCGIKGVLGGVFADAERAASERLAEVSLAEVMRRIAEQGEIGVAS